MGLRRHFSRLQRSTSRPGSVRCPPFWVSSAPNLEHGACRCYFPLEHIVFSGGLASEKFPRSLGGEEGFQRVEVCDATIFLSRGRAWRGAGAFFIMPHFVFGLGRTEDDDNPDEVHLG